MASYFQIVRQRVRQRQFRSLFLFVTSRCNSRCRTCFYFDQLNRRDDLSFDQIRTISQTAPPFEKLWLSGGEPFLRPELAEIVILFARQNGVRNVNLPTNGLLPDKIFAALDRILCEAPDLTIDLNFSLDGLSETHDFIRGVPENFRRTLKTISEAERRYRGIYRLRRNVLTVITSQNYYELVQLARQLAAEANLDGHYFEALRGVTPDQTLKQLTTEQLRDLHRRLMPIHRHYARKLFARYPPWVQHLATVYYLGNLRLHFDLHEQCFDKPRPWPMPCTAGQTTLVVDHNGKFRACELRGVVGDLREYDYDVRAALASRAMKAEIAAIRQANCWCTHSCFIQESSKFSPRVQLFTIPWAWWRQRGEQLADLPAEQLKQFRNLEIT
ncbi:MAG: radical SAM protein [Bryobacteraceae bacterium]|nr:radical SAM protein [Bryobacteraceae bacterium]MDW8377745.1 radical SAM protein [Bryobacterales bacterium]